jgi:hypothetical protein
MHLIDDDQYVDIYFTQWNSGGSFAYYRSEIKPPKGIISMTPGTQPFYTTDTNPITITLNEGESQLITWSVVATGGNSRAPTYEFFAFANLSSDPFVSSISDRVNITTLYPNVSIEWVSPTVNSDVGLGTTTPFTAKVTCHNGDCGVINLGIDPPSADDCYVYNGYYWYAATSTGQNCDTVCASHGGTSDPSCTQPDSPSCEVGQHFFPGYPCDGGCCNENPTCDVWGWCHQRAYYAWDCWASDPSYYRLCTCNAACSGKHGLVSNTPGDIPFYTNEANPTTISLNEGESMDVTWNVVATGDDPTNPTSTFFAYANLSSDERIKDMTDNINITILYPYIEINLIEPAGPTMNVGLDEEFDYTVEVICRNGDCGEVIVGLDPIAKVGDSGSFDFCDIPWSGGLVFDANQETGVSQGTTGQIYRNGDWYLDSGGQIADTGTSDFASVTCSPSDGYSYTPSSLMCGTCNTICVKTNDNVYAKINPNCGCGPCVTGNWEITYAGGKNGLVSTTFGAMPFYTIDSNPRTIYLNEDQSQTLTWHVVTTGDSPDNPTYEFFTIANITSMPAIENIGGNINITIVYPQLDITWVTPTTDTAVEKNEIFDMTVQVTCSNADCGDLIVSLDPEGTYYFDSSWGADPITPSLSLSRGGGGTLCNSLVEGCGPRWQGYTSNPSGTEWALGTCKSPGTFSDFFTTVCRGGRCGDNILNKDFCMHVTAEDIYYDIYFTNWGRGYSNYFTYYRSATGFGRKGGLVPVGSGAPFYTLDSNPTTITLNQGDSQQVTWRVDPNTDSTSPYAFFAYVNKSSLMSVNDETETILINTTHLPPNITVTLVSPTSSIGVDAGTTLDFIVNVTCNNADCGSVDTSLDPVGTYYYDSSSGIPDSITPSVSIWRGSAGTICNYLTDYCERRWWGGVTNPSGTEWAIGTCDSVSSFGDFFNTVCLSRCGDNVINKDLCLHVTAEDKYYDVYFTSWGRGWGQFAYYRTTEKSLVSTDPSARPFYTTFSNPYTLTLNRGESQLITWPLVVAGGSLRGNTSEFFANASMTSDPMINATSDKVNITILYPYIEFELITPTVNGDLDINEAFDYTIKATCRNGDCGNVNIGLDPPARVGDSGTTMLHDSGEWMDFDTETLVSYGSSEGDLSKGDNMLGTCCYFAPNSGAQQVDAGSTDFANVQCNPSDGRSYSSSNVRDYGAMSNVWCLKTPNNVYVKYYTLEPCCDSINVQWEITYAGGKSGYVSNAFGDKPFYTLDSNPTSMTLNEDQSQTLTWHVVTTGDNPNNPTTEFYVISNITSYGIVQEGPKLNLTIVYPQVDITWVTPTTDTTIEKDTFFDMTAQITCSNADCGQIDVSLDPEGTYYYDSSSGIPDSITPSVSIWRGGAGTICNSLTDYCERRWSGGVTNPSGTEWAVGTCDSAGSFGDFFGTACSSRCGNNIMNKDLCLHVIAENKYYDVYFTSWGRGWGQFAYFRSLNGFSAKGGLVPVGSGTPFYTIDSNPTSVTLNNGDTQTVTWRVYDNADLNSTYRFFAFANVSSLPTANDETEKIYVLTQEPITIVSPLDGGLYSEDVSFNITLNTFDGVSCTYSLDSAPDVAMTMINARTFTAMEVGLADGPHSVVFSCTDAGANVKSKSSTFSTQAGLRQSCKEILDNGESVGDGVYTIWQEGSTIQVLCDMTTDGGGWTLVLNHPLTTGVFAVSGWTSGNLVGSTSDFTNTLAYWKMSDNMINALKTNAFRGQGSYGSCTGGSCSGTNTFYWRATCDLNVATWATGACADAYSDYLFTSSLGTNDASGGHYGLCANNYNVPIYGGCIAHQGDYVWSGPFIDGRHAYTGRWGEQSGWQLWVQ